MKQRTDTLETACKDFEEDLVLYYYGDGSQADRDRVKNHIEECECCRSFLEDLRKLLPHMARTEELPESFWDNYYREVVKKLADQQERGAWWRNFFAPMRAWAVPALGTAVATVFAVALVLGNGTVNFRLSRQSQEKIPQEILADTNQLEFFNSLDMLESLQVLESLEGTKTEPINS